MSTKSTIKETQKQNAIFPVNFPSIRSNLLGYFTTLLANQHREESKNIIEGVNNSELTPYYSESQFEHQMWNQTRCSRNHNAGNFPGKSFRADAGEGSRRRIRVGWNSECNVRGGNY